MANEPTGIAPLVPVGVLRAGHIGVVTITYNSAGVLGDFFDSMAAQTYRAYTLYIIDNASRDTTMELCRRRSGLPVVILANKDNVGVAEGNNQGILAALADGCEFVLLLNNDTVFDPHLLEGLSDGIVRHHCAMVTPKILYYDEPNKIWAAGGYFQPWLGYRAMHYGEGEQDVGQFDEARPISYAPTCCVLIRREVFEQIGIMDPRYFIYSDDVDFMYRALKADIATEYLPSCTLLHKVSSLTGGVRSPFAYRYGTRNRILFLKKHLSYPSAQAWIGLYTAHILLSYLFGRISKETWVVRKNAITEGLAMSRTARAADKSRTTIDFLA
jgi:hypothetical protein